MNDAQLPVQYNEAVQALVACQTIDESKYWADKADALSAWAKIYRNDEVGREAKRLKLHAYRRMGQLAGELHRKKRYTKGDDGRFAGAAPGPMNTLKQAGLSEHNARFARQISAVPEEKFESLVSQPTPPGIRSAALLGRGLLPGHRSRYSDAFLLFVGGAYNQGWKNFRQFCRKNDAKELARGLWPDEAKEASEIATEIEEWLDTFKQYLPKSDD